MKLTADFPFNKDWHIVEVPHTESLVEKVIWCKQHISDGRVYHWNFYDNPQTRCGWWFEKEEDAMMFALKFL